MAGRGEGVDGLWFAGGGGAGCFFTGDYMRRHLMPLGGLGTTVLAARARAAPWAIHTFRAGFPLGEMATSTFRAGFPLREMVMYILRT